VVVGGEPAAAAFFVMTLPYSDAFYCCIFPKDCPETFQEGHVRAFAYFGGVPARISYDNSKIAVATIVGRRGATPTREFLRLESHFLFEHRFCRVRRPNEKGHVEVMVGFALPATPPGARHERRPRPRRSPRTRAARSAATSGSTPRPRVASASPGRSRRGSCSNRCSIRRTLRCGPRRCG
jgi:hypothetical protein